MDQNKEWVKTKKFKHKDFFDELRSQHKPSYFWIVCADVNVLPPNEIIGQDAVCVLQVRHIIVCGHYGCIGVRESMDDVGHHNAPLENCFINLRDVYRLHHKQLDAITDIEERNRRLVELNTIEQCINVYKTRVVQHRRVETYENCNFPMYSPTVHAVVFDSKDGTLNPLKVDFNAYFDELNDIYDMYDVPQVMRKTNIESGRFKRLKQRLFGMKQDKPSYTLTWKSGYTQNKDIENLFKANKAWIKSKSSVDSTSTFFEKLSSKNNKPSYLWIGSADVRVPANEMIGEPPGSVFVVSNVANIVQINDISPHSALQYTVSELKVPHIIVCGHYDCGGVRACMEDNKDYTSPLENWLRNIRDVYRIHAKELDAIIDPEIRHRRLVELNVVEQCINIYKTRVVQARLFETHKDLKLPFSFPRIFPVVFDPKTGFLKSLQSEFQESVKELNSIYELYSIEEPTEEASSNEFAHNEYAAKNKDIDNILRQNKAWVKSKVEEDVDFLRKLGGANSKPSYLWIGCADAQVPANVIMGKDEGSIFVTLNIANIVSNTDFNLLSVLQYAVCVLKVPHIIVCGHYECSDIRAFMSNKDHNALLDNWLRNIRDVYRTHREELDAISDPEQRHRRLVELNVIQQCINVYTNGDVQRRRLETLKDPNAPFSSPIVHACVFNPKEGILKELEVDFDKYRDQLHSIYDLYGAKSYATIIDS